MADFVQTMNDWRRMCKYYDEKTGNNSCDFCPLNGCNAIYEDDGNTDYSDIEEKVAAWAAEHPEPVYPTWKEWLEEQRVVVHFDSVNEKGKKVKWELTNKSNCPIPADIAQKLGIEPKEG